MPEATNSERGAGVPFSGQKKPKYGLFIEPPRMQRDIGLAASAVPG